MASTLTSSSTAPATDDRPRLVFFTAATSGRCRQVEGWVAHILQHRRNHLRIKLVTVDATARPDLVDRFGVERLPTFVVVENETAAARLECPRNTREIVDMLAPYLA